MFSDNGTNFVGTKNKLKDLLNLINDTQHQAAVANYCTNEGIRWHFSPPRAPHFGGLWEAAVKSAKYHLLRVVGEDAMSPEDFQTLLAQVEACLNSRPITPLSDDPNDLEPLTPGHFLIGSSLQDLPEPDWKAIPTNRLDLFQRLQQKLHQFWERWRREYLCQLQGRTKRKNEPKQVSQNTSTAAAKKITSPSTGINDRKREPVVKRHQVFERKRACLQLALRTMAQNREMARSILDPI
ncbi:uncharacterized protein LOC134222503 [Armigeres subalbatus]|uniref:uncharacterized protein LOC134222503 n=1 Tax=Armigeres subalbatus TaxID=124917 RepID=UPI002ED15C2E